MVVFAVSIGYDLCIERVRTLTGFGDGSVFGEKRRIYTATWTPTEESRWVSRKRDYSKYSPMLSRSPMTQSSFQIS